MSTEHSRGTQVSRVASNILTKSPLPSCLNTVAFLSFCRCSSVIVRVVGLPRYLGVFETGVTVLLEQLSPADDGSCEGKEG